MNTPFPLPPPPKPNRWWGNPSSWTSKRPQTPWKRITLYSSNFSKTSKPSSAISLTEAIAMHSWWRHSTVTRYPPELNRLASFKPKFCVELDAVSYSHLNIKCVYFAVFKHTTYRNHSDDKSTDSTTTFHKPCGIISLSYFELSTWIKDDGWQLRELMEPKLLTPVLPEVPCS